MKFNKKYLNPIVLSKKIICKLDDYRLLHLSDLSKIKLMYNVETNQKLDLKNPKTFNEKLQWLKIHDRNPNYTKMVDKYEVKKYVSDIIGEEYIIPTLGIYNSFDEIDFDKLPNQFVIKCTHDSGGLVIVKDKSKLDINAAKKKINKCLKRNYYWRTREWPYKNIVPRIIVEPYFEDKKVHELIDYKFMCFNGEAKMLFTCSERFLGNKLKVTFFDMNWNRLPFERKYNASNKHIDKPINFDKMVNFSEKLAQNIIFVRVDWYEINGKLYFGELTFYPGSGLEKFTPEIWDYKLGDYIDITKVGEKHE